MTGTAIGTSLNGDSTSSSDDEDSKPTTASNATKSQPDDTAAATSATAAKAAETTAAEPGVPTEAIADANTADAPAVDAAVDEETDNFGRRCRRCSAASSSPGGGTPPPRCSFVYSNDCRNFDGSRSRIEADSPTSSSPITNVHYLPCAQNAIWVSQFNFTCSCDFAG